MPAHIAKLQATKAVFDKVYDFKPGDLVIWKKGLKNRARPALNEPAIVVAVLEKPLIDNTKEVGSTYFNEPLDLVLGLLDEDGDFITFHYDHRRFEPYQTD
ncbi:MAG: hypothetical protein HC877_23705 [Thioploca sp.]|nr:hypothetical protein [Thioploca sp.]